MLDQSTVGALTDPAVLAALGTVGTGCAAVGAGSMRLLEWWVKRGRERTKDQLESTRVQLEAEDKIREDLLAEIHQLRSELAAARTELREFGLMHQRMITEHQERYGKLLVEVAELRAMVLAGGPSTP